MCGECCCHLLTNCFSDVGIGGNNGFLWTASSDWSHLLFTEKRHSSVLVSCLKPVVWKNVEADAATKNVNATPTLFINGKQLIQSHYLDLAALKADFAAVGVK